MYRTITMEEFELFPYNTVEEDLKSLKTLLDQNFTLELVFPQSTAVNQDLVILSETFANNDMYNFIITSKNFSLYSKTEKRLCIRINKIVNKEVK